MDTDLSARLDQSIGDPPDGPDPLPGLLAAGRRSVRRRRAAVVSASAAAVLAVAGGTALATGGDSGRAAPPPAGSPSVSVSVSVTPSATTAASPTPSAPPGAEPWPYRGEVVAVDPTTGEVEIRPGATVLDQVDNPFGLAPPSGSSGLSVSWRGRVQWWAVAWNPDGSTYAYTHADAESVGFRGWLERVSGIAAADDATASPPGAPDRPEYPGIAADLVAFVGPTEELGPGDGVTILEQRPHVRVGDAFAGPEARTAAALVRTGGGERYYVLARVVDGEELQDIAVPVARGGPDLDAFLAFARQRYAEGTGLL